MADGVRLAQRFTGPERLSQLDLPAPRPSHGEGAIRSTHVG